jgi:hypothetical protein
MVDIKACVTSYKFRSFELSPVIYKDPLGMTNLYMILCRNLIAASCMMFTTGIAFIHLVNVSIATNKNLNPPGALGRTPTDDTTNIHSDQGPNNYDAPRGWT